MTPEQVQLFLDELARLTLRHGLALRDRRDGTSIEPLAPDFQGYSAVPPTGEAVPWPFYASHIGLAGALASRDITEIPSQAHPDDSKEATAEGSFVSIVEQLRADGHGALPRLEATPLGSLGGPARTRPGPKLHPGKSESNE